MSRILNRILGRLNLVPKEIYLKQLYNAINQVE